MCACVRVRAVVCVCMGVCVFVWQKTYASLWVCVHDIACVRMPVCVHARTSLWRGPVVSIARRATGGRPRVRRACCAIGRSPVCVSKLYWVIGRFARVARCELDHSYDQRAMGCAILAHDCDRRRRRHLRHRRLQRHLLPGRLGEHRWRCGPDLSLLGKMFFSARAQALAHSHTHRHTRTDTHSRTRMHELRTFICVALSTSYDI